MDDSRCAIHIRSLGDQLACASSPNCSPPLTPPPIYGKERASANRTRIGFCSGVLYCTQWSTPTDYSLLPSSSDCAVLPTMAPRICWISFAFFFLAALVVCAAASSSSLPSHVTEESALASAGVARPQVAAAGRLRRLLTEAHSVQGRRLAILRRFRRKAVKQIVRNRMKRAVSKTMCKAMCTWDPLRMTCVNSNHVKC